MAAKKGTVKSVSSSMKSVSTGFSASTVASQSLASISASTVASQSLTGISASTVASQSLAGISASKVASQSLAGGFMSAKGENALRSVRSEGRMNFAGKAEMMDFGSSMQMGAMQKSIGGMNGGFVARGMELNRSMDGLASFERGMSKLEVQPEDSLGVRHGMGFGEAFGLMGNLSRRILEEKAVPEMQQGVKNSYTAESLMPVMMDTMMPAMMDTMAFGTIAAEGPDMMDYFMPDMMGLMMNAFMPSMMMADSMQALALDPSMLQQQIDPRVDEKGEPVLYSNLVVLTIPELTIETFKITSKVNEHAKLHITGHIEDDGSYLLTNTMVSTPLQVAYYTKDGSLMPFFAGVITNIRVYKKESNQAVEIIALSNSSTLDTVKLSQSCQKIGTKYSELMEARAMAGGAYIYYGAQADKYQTALGTISVQYKETTWDYLKRLASHKNQGLFTDMTQPFSLICVGAPEGECKEFNPEMYEFTKEIRNYEIDHANYIEEIQNEDYIICRATSYNILKIGDAVMLENKKYYIREAVYEMKNAIVEGSYLLCSENGLQQRRIKNEKLQGLSINGITQGVERDKVKIQLDIDQQPNADYLFPYSTISASPDGSGWYCMPQNGDLLRVYFPDDEEANCFAISSVSSYTPDQDGAGGGGGGGADRMGDPSVRYLRTPDNKEIMLSPDGITINADDGQGLIIIDNAGNVTISAANSITMTATNDITISASNNVTIAATDTIKLSGAGGAVEMDSSGNTRLTGAYVLEN